MSPTWIFGWPLTSQYSQEYAHALGMSQEEEESKSQWRWRVVSTTIMDVMKRCRIPNTYPRVCWVDGKCTLVFPLTIDYGAKSVEEAESRVPPWMETIEDHEYEDWIEAAEELGWMLGTADGAKWYRYHDGSWGPVSGELDPESIGCFA